MEYADVKAVPIIAYSLAGIVGITRMTEHTHWASDVFVGAWAGYLCGKQVVNYHRKLFGTSRIGVKLVIEKRCNGSLAIQWTFRDSSSGWSSKLFSFVRTEDLIQSLGGWQLVHPVIRDPVT
jgi:hypothetical protein